MIVCIDPDDAALERTRVALEAAGHETRGAQSREAARRLVESERVDGLVTEYDLPDGTGLDVVRVVRTTAPDVPCVLFTGTPVEGIDTAAFGDVIVEYVHKGAPDAHDALVEGLSQGLALRSQTAYPLPDDEDARLAALDRYAADPEALSRALERLTEVATALFDVDSAAVGLVDAHEERFLGCHGITIDAVDREHTVCTYAILDDEVTVVEDTTEDPRFRNNRAIREAGIRFYAGAPVVTPDGHAIGTFCLFDDEPGSLSGREASLLERLADEVVDQLELRRRLDGTADGSDGAADGDPAPGSVSAPGQPGLEHEHEHEHEHEPVETTTESGGGTDE